MSNGAAFTPFDLSGLPLKNRIVMAPMTRGRATNSRLVPTELHVEYYRQRASAGLIVSEAAWVSREAIGFVNVPGLFSEEQVKGWRAVTDAVHAECGAIYAQLAHSGAVSHPDFFAGELPLAPSAVNPRLRSFTKDGFKDTLTPRPMTIGDIMRTVDDYGKAARNAREAGFDGVEIHAGSSYLLPQFLNSVLNRREDRYGGSPENQARIVVEILERAIDEWGPGRVGVKISPSFAAGGLAPTDRSVLTYDHLVARLNDLPLSHLQIVRALSDLRETPVALLQDTIGYYRLWYLGVLMANFAYDLETANSEIAKDRADLVSFGKPFIGNPDLVRRFAEGKPLHVSNADTYYQGGREGYADYALIGDAQQSFA